MSTNDKYAEERRLPTRELANKLWDRIGNAWHWGDEHQAAFNELVQVFEAAEERDRLAREIAVVRADRDVLANTRDAYVAEADALRDRLAKIEELAREYDALPGEDKDMAAVPLIYAILRHEPETPKVERATDPEARKWWKAIDELADAAPTETPKGEEK